MLIRSQDKEMIINMTVRVFARGRMDNVQR